MFLLRNLLSPVREPIAPGSPIIFFRFHSTETGREGTKEIKTWAALYSSIIKLLQRKGLLLTALKESPNSFVPSKKLSTVFTIFLMLVSCQILPSNCVPDHADEESVSLLNMMCQQFVHTQIAHFRKQRCNSWAPVAPRKQHVWRVSSSVTECTAGCPGFLYPPCCKEERSKLHWTSEKNLSSFSQKLALREYGTAPGSPCSTLIPIWLFRRTVMGQLCPKSRYYVDKTAYSTNESSLWS